MKIKDLVRYRSAWMGFAMLWIVFYHSRISIDFMPFTIIKGLGYGGVDIFFFASGIGCYYSLNKDPDILRFMKRRIARLAPIYVPFIILWIIGKSFFADYSFSAAVGNILGVQHFTGLGKSFNWYISALLLFYLLAPYFKSIIDRTGNRGFVLSLALLLAMTIPFWTAREHIIYVTRIPIFFIGMFLGRLCWEEKCIDRRHVVIGIVAMLVGALIILFCARYFSDYLWPYGLYWYPYILITPGLCLCISCVVSWIEKVRWLSWIKTGLDAAGKNSFEIYLVHVPVMEFFIYLTQIPVLSPYKNYIWVVFILIQPALCYIFKRYVHLVSVLAKKCFRRAA